MFMLSYKTLGISVFVALLICSCNPYIEKGVRKKDLSKDVEMITEQGRIVIRLSDETPKHRNNFIRLVNEGFYNNVLFHRVIKNFLIQAGDPKSKTAGPDELLGDNDLPYAVPKELSATLFHKRGALNAARNSDDENPEQNSSSTQFTFIQGTIFTDSTLNLAEKRLNAYLAYNRVIHQKENAATFSALQRLVKSKGNADSISLLSKKLKALAAIDQAKNPPYRIPEAQRNIYKTIGGAPHLDRSYTVFGEIVYGLDVVDKIANMETNKDDRPVRDVKIISTRMIPRKEYK